MKNILKPYGATLLLAVLCSGCMVTAEKLQDPVTPQPAVNIQAIMDAAKDAYEKGDYEQALMRYRQVVEIDNDHHKANYNITVIYLELMISGMEFLGQYIDNPKDARDARTALNQLAEQAGIFTRITSKYME